MVALLLNRRPFLGEPFPELLLQLVGLPGLPDDAVIIVNLLGDVLDELVDFFGELKFTLVLVPGGAFDAFQDSFKLLNVQVLVLDLLLQLLELPPEFVGLEGVGLGSRRVALAEQFALGLVENVAL